MRSKAKLLELTAKAMPGCRRGDHFTPPYDPWDQRLCLIPDGDLYRAVNAGTVEVVTDTVDTVAPTHGIDGAGDGLTVGAAAQGLAGAVGSDHDRGGL